MSYKLVQFAPIALHVCDVGPFQHQKFTFDFHDAGGAPANVYVILGVNGLGKTTLLESIAFLVGILDGDPVEADDPPWLQDHPRARLQLDVLVTLDTGTGSSKGVVSLVANKGVVQGDTEELKFWLEEDLTRDDASWWVRDGYITVFGGRERHLVSTDRHGEPNEEGIRLLEVGVRGGLSRAQENALRHDLMDPVENAPALLYFTAHRDLMKATPPSERFLRRPEEWSHSLVRRFGAEQGVWPASLDHLLTWLDYVDEGRTGGRFDQACRIVNEYLFAGADQGPSKALTRVDRERLQAVVTVSTPVEGELRAHESEHRLDRLSGGERSLAQIFVRLAAHMTLNTIVLIDEADVHLHPAWERELMWALKEFVKDHPGTMLILTTHSMDMLKVYRVKDLEEGLSKGGYILDSQQFQLGAHERE